MTDLQNIKGALLILCAIQLLLMGASTLFRRDIVEFHSDLGSINSAHLLTCTALGVVDVLLHEDLNAFVWFFCACCAAHRMWRYSSE